MSPNLHDGDNPLGGDMKLLDPAELRQALRDADLNQSQLGRRVGASRAYINKLMTGRARTCPDGRATQIEEVLGKDPGDLFVPEEGPDATHDGSAQEIAS